MLSELFFETAFRFVPHAHDRAARNDTRAPLSESLCAVALRIPISFGKEHVPAALAAPLAAGKAFYANRVGTSRTKLTFS